MNARAMLLLALLALPCASDALAQCSYATPTTGQIYTMPTVGMVTQIYGSRMQSSWVVTAVSGVLGEDWDVALYQNPSATSPCVANPLASSTYGGNSVDFVIGDGSVNPHTDVYARHNRYSGAGVGRAQWRDGARALAVNGFDVARTWGVDSLVDVWSVTLTAGATYTINFSPSVGLGAALMLYRNPTAGSYWAPRSAALATLSSTGTFTAPSTGNYALVVANDAHAAGTYTISVGDCTPIALTSGVISSRDGKQAMWQFDQSAAYWTVLASERGPVEVYSAVSGAYPTCGSGLLESWTAPGSTPSFVVGNFNAIPPGRFYARTVTPAGFFGSTVQWDSGIEQLVVDGPPVRRSFDNTHPGLAEAWDLYLVAGETYRFYFDSQGGGYVAYLFADPGTGNHWFDPGAAVASASSSIFYTATTTGYHGVVVINSDEYSNGRYTLGVSKAPCGIPATLAARVPTTLSSADSWFRLYPVTSGWGAVAVRGGSASDDWDLSMSADPSGEAAPRCIGPVLATSITAPGVTEVTAFTMAGTRWDYQFAHTHHASAPGTNGVAEFDTTHGRLFVNDPQTQGTMSATSLVHAYDAYMVAGYTYTIEFVPSVAGLSVLLFENPGDLLYGAGRGEAVASGSSSVTYTALVTGIHGVTVVNDAGVAGTYRIRLGQCLTAVSLSNNVGQQPSYADQTYMVTPFQQRWAAVGVRSTTKDWDLSVSASLGTTYPNCLSAPVGSSSSSALNFVDFVVGDFHHMSMANHYARAYQYSPGAEGAAYVNWSYATEALVPNVINMAPAETGPLNPVRIFDTHLEAGTTYTIGLTHTGTANLHLLLFRNPGSGTYWAGRSSAVLDLAVAAGSTTYTPPASDDYALVVVNDDGVADTYIPYVRYCPPVVPLTSGLPIVVYPSAFVSFTQETPYWMAIGVRSASDWDMEVDRLAGGGAPGFCFSDLLALSNATNMVDFVVGDFNVGANAMGTYYARPNAYHALSNPGAVEFERGTSVLDVGVQPVSRETGDSDVLDVWDAFMVGGRDYSLYFTHTGYADVKALLFRNPGGAYWAPRSARVLETTGHVIYHAPVTGYYGLVVVNDNGLPGQYTIGVQPAGVGVEGDALPARTMLESVSPNPARGPLTVQFALHAPALVKLELLDLSGRRVATLEEGARDAGRFSVAWSGARGGARAVPPGLYCLRLTAGGRTVGEKKVVLIR